MNADEVQQTLDDIDDALVLELWEYGDAMRWTPEFVDHPSLDIHSEDAIRWSAQAWSDHNHPIIEDVRDWYRLIRQAADGPLWPRQEAILAQMINYPDRAFRL